MKKPYKHPNGRMQFRDSSGRFYVPSLGCKICEDCRAIIVPEIDYSMGFKKTVWPDKCHQCGSENIAN